MATSLHPYLQALLREEAAAGARAIARRLLEAPRDDSEVFVSLAPVTVAMAMLNPLNLLGDAEPEEMEVLLELRRQVCEFFRDARAGKVVPFPEREELTSAFGSDLAPVVEAIWPIVAVFAELVGLDENVDLAQEARWKRESWLMWNARTICLVRHPPKIAAEHHAQQVRGFVHRSAMKWNVLGEDVLAQVNDHLESPQIQASLLATYDPKSGKTFYGRWKLTVVRKAGDLAERWDRTSTGYARPARSTVSKYKDRLDGSKSASDLREEGNERRRHHDPTGRVLTLRELERADGRKPDAYRHALHRAELKEGKKAPRRGRVAALDPTWQALVRLHAGGTRAPRKDVNDPLLTLREAAALYDVEPNALLSHMEAAVEASGQKLEVSLKMKLQRSTWKAILELR